MCGRYVINLDENVYERFGAIKGKLSLGNNVNASPGQELPVVLMDQGKKVIELVSWGYVVHWDDKKKTNLINTRAESVDKKSIYDRGWKLGRCLIPANGFYEWKKDDGKKPYLFYQKNNSYFGMAGLVNESDGGLGFTIITTRANKDVSSIHDRMPVILENENDESRWLDIRTNEKDLVKMLSPLRTGELLVKEVSSKSNKAG